MKLGRERTPALEVAGHGAEELGARFGARRRAPGDDDDRDAAERRQALEVGPVVGERLNARDGDAGHRQHQVLEVLQRDGARGTGQGDQRTADPAFEILGALTSEGRERLEHFQRRRRGGDLHERTRRDVTGRAAAGLIGGPDLGPVHGDPADPAVAERELAAIGIEEIDAIVRTDAVPGRCLLPGRIGDAAGDHLDARAPGHHRRAAEREGLGRAPVAPVQPLPRLVDGVSDRQRVGEDAADLRRAVVAAGRHPGAHEVRRRRGRRGEATGRVSGCGGEPEPHEAGERERARLRPRRRRAAPRGRNRRGTPRRGAPRSAPGRRRARAACRGAPRHAPRPTRRRGGRASGDLGPRRWSPGKGREMRPCARERSVEAEVERVADRR